VSDSPIKPGFLDIEMQKHCALLSKSKQGGERRGPRIRGVSWTKAQQFGIRELIDSAEAVCQPVEHVVVEQNEHAIRRQTNVHLASVRSVIHCRRVGLQRILRSERAGAAVDDDDRSGETVSDPRMTGRA
jgi:hypothetical protein